MIDKNRLFCLILFLFSVTHLQAGRPKYIELKSDKGTFQGRVESKNKYACWLIDRDGKLNGLNLSKVKKFRTVSTTFSPYSIPELKSQLAKEFGKQFKIASDGQYIVCASSQHANAYAQLFDDTYRSFRNYFSRKGFHLPKPEFPLVAIVFPDFNSYSKYQRKEGLNPSRGIIGYYMRTSNRVALYENNNPSLSLKQSSLDQNSITNLNQSAYLNQPIDQFLMTQDSHLSGLNSFMNSFDTRTASNNIDQINSRMSEISLPFARISRTEKSLEATIIHEATHQIAFNTGLHSRIGDTPKWIIEGLATVFEVPGIRDSKTTVKAIQRVNRDRYIWFRNYLSKRRKEKSLVSFISGDQKFQSNGQQTVLDAYSEAWALSFFFLETQPVKYARYLRKITARKGSNIYPAQERLKDFKSVFGNGIAKIEIDFIRFIERL